MKSTRIFMVLTCAAFWLQGLYYGWESYLLLLLIAGFLAIRLMYERRQAVGFLYPRSFIALFLLYMAGLGIQSFMSATDSTILALGQALLVIMFVYLGKVVLTREAEIVSWYRILAWNVTGLLLYGWYLRAVTGGLLESVFGYANVIAYLCLVSLLLHVHFWLGADRTQKIWHAGGMVTALVSLVATEARIVWALAACALLALLLVERKQNGNVFGKGKLLIVVAGVSMLTCAWVIGTFSAEGMAALLQTSSLRLRITYAWDALRLIADHPLWGIGAGEWANLQYQYQTALYSVQHVHQQLLQSWLDGGLLSLIGFGGLGICLLADLPAVFRMEAGAERRFALTVWLISSTGWIYSWFDFTLAFPAVLILCVFYVNARGFWKKPSRTYAYTASIRWGVGSGLVAIAAISAVFFLQEWNGKGLERAIETNQLYTALSYESLPVWQLSTFQRASGLGRAYVEKAKRTQEKDDWLQAQAYLQSGIKARSTDGKQYDALLYVSVQLADQQTAEMAARELIRLQPSLSAHYETYALLLANAGKTDELRQLPAQMAQHKQWMMEHALFVKHIPALKPSARFMELVQ